MCDMRPFREYYSIVNRKIAYTVCYMITVTLLCQMYIPIDGGDADLLEGLGAQSSCHHLDVAWLGFHIETGNLRCDVSSFAGAVYDHAAGGRKREFDVTACRVTFHDGV